MKARSFISQGQRRLSLLCSLLLFASVVNGSAQSSSEMYVESRNHGESGSKIYSMLSVNNLEVRRIASSFGSPLIDEIKSELTFYTIEVGTNVSIFDFADRFGVYGISGTAIGYNDAESSFLLRLRSGLRIGYGSWSRKDRQKGFGGSLGLDFAYEGMTDENGTQLTSSSKIIEVTTDRNTETSNEVLKDTWVDGFAVYLAAQASYTFSPSFTIGIRYSQATRMTLFGHKAFYSSELFGAFLAFNM